MRRISYPISSASRASKIFQTTALLVLISGGLQVRKGVAQTQADQQGLTRPLVDSVVSLKADCTVAGPFAGSYQRGWSLEYDTENTLWLVRGGSYRSALQQTARGYVTADSTYMGGALYVQFEPEQKTRQLRIRKVARDGSPGSLIDQVTQTEARAVSCPDAVTEEKVQAALPQLTSMIENAIADGRIPGLAVGVVYQGRVVYLNGFGVREVGNPEQVDPDTVFQLASLSKPISSTIVSALVSDGLVKWNDRIVKYDPGFELSDPVRTAKVTIGDMFAHRSGLPGSAGDDLEQIGYRQKGILERIRFLPLAYPFRGGYQYSNFGLTEGGVAAAMGAGERWPAASRNRLFEPLGMTQASMRYADFVARVNRAHLHIMLNNQWTPALTRDADAQAPAGGASASVRDLMQWVILELGDGEYGGKQLISREALNAARTPQVIRGSNPDTGLPAFYGFGWNLDYLADGVFQLGHSGAFTRGAGTNVTLLPSQGLGVVALGNAFPTGVPEAVSSILLDLTRYGHVTKDWFTYSKEQFDAAFVVPAEQQIARYANPPVPNVPALDLAAYTGTYRNGYVGRVEIAAANGGLYLIRGVGQAPLPLRHWDENTFLSFPSPENPAVPATVEFTVGADGQALQLMIEELNSGGGGTLTRVKTTK